MHVSVSRADGLGRVQLRVLTAARPWRISIAGESDEALLDPRTGAFVAEGYPDWLRALCAPIDADRVLAEDIVREVRRREGQ